MSGTLRRLIMGLIAIAAIGGIVFAFSGPPDDSAPKLPAAVEAVSPVGGNLDLRQVTILADLAPGYTGYLLIDGVEIPRDDVQFVAALNHVILRPTAESDYKELRPGPHCVSVVYYQIGRPESEANSFQWCFRLH